MKREPPRRPKRPPRATQDAVLAAVGGISKIIDFPLVFNDFLRSRGVLRVSCGALGVLLGGLRGGLGVNASIWGARHRPNTSQDLFGTLQNRSKTLQDRPKIVSRPSQDRPKTLPNRPKTPPRPPKTRPKTSRDRSRSPRPP